MALSSVSLNEFIAGFPQLRSVNKHLPGKATSFAKLILSNCLMELRIEGRDVVMTDITARSLFRLE